MTEPTAGANMPNAEQDPTHPAGKQPRKTTDAHAHPDHTLDSPQKPRHSTKPTSSMVPISPATGPSPIHDNDDDAFMDSGQRTPQQMPEPQSEHARTNRESPTARIARNIFIARASSTAILSAAGFQFPTFAKECTKVPSQLAQSPHQCVPSSDGEDTEFISRIGELRVTLNSGWFRRFLSTTTWLMTGFSITMRQAILDDSENWVSLVPFNGGSTLFREVPNIIDIIADLLFKLGIEVEDMSSPFVGQTMPTPNRNTRAGGRGARGNRGAVVAAGVLVDEVAAAAIHLPHPPHTLALNSVITFHVTPVISDTRSWMVGQFHSNLRMSDTMTMAHMLYTIKHCLWHSTEFGNIIGRIIPGTATTPQKIMLFTDTFDLALQPYDIVSGGVSHKCWNLYAAPISHHSSILTQDQEEDMVRQFIRTPEREEMLGLGQGRSLRA
ncbi:hypothetical protein BDP27DRAFT_1430349 [Rhodocollybia butyracea]|uniref:Uncharacterized protein n=1 Tax=Rhodocollybia butyracea TaxID=206335 RepID=A0A9P5U069_9AGAR|nr:hypothetical protein BDP27DRAFT_1430349 [Rhodocollybia butyracea]